MAKHIKSPKQYCYFDESGKVNVSSLSVFNEGLAAVLDKRNDKWGFMDESFEVVIPCQWRYAGRFSEGLAAVADEHGKWGFIDKSGEIVLPCQWRYAGRFSEGLAAVADEHGKWGFIDKMGKIVIPCQWKLAYVFSEGLAAVMDEHGNLGFIDKTGWIVISCQWKYTGKFSEGLAAVADEHDKWGFLDRTGKGVIPCKWKKARGFSEGLAAVTDEQDKCGFIDNTGNIVIPCQWKLTDDFYGGKAWVMNEQAECFKIDKAGNKEDLDYIEVSEMLNICKSLDEEFLIYRKMVELSEEFVWELEEELLVDPINTRSFPSDLDQYAGSMDNMAFCYIEKEEYAKAVPLLERALQLYRIQEFYEPIFVFQRYYALKRLAKCHKELGNRTMAILYEHESRLLEATSEVLKNNGGDNKD